MSTNKILDLCYFKVPVIITENEEGDKTATFKEVEMKDLCYKIVEVETESAVEAQAEAIRLSSLNNTELKLAAKVNKTGDIVTRIIMCDHGRVSINNKQ